ncbi:MAG: Rab5-interacting family protein [Terriglobus roseus]|nr:Rab5-interacting family protein [Terriglobus roseus]
MTFPGAEPHLSCGQFGQRQRTKLPPNPIPPTMADEARALAINPIVQDSVQHNARVRFSLVQHPPGPSFTNAHHQTLSTIRALTASLFGVAAGILGLESYPGFAFYLIGTLAVSALVFALKIGGASGGDGAAKSKGGAAAYFWRPATDLWMGEVVGNMMGFVLTWTLFYGLVRA